MTENHTIREWINDSVKVDTLQRNLLDILYKKESINQNQYHIATQSLGRLIGVLLFGRNNEVINRKNLPVVAGQGLNKHENI